MTDTIHGIRIEDPYRSLEEESAATRTWIDTQSERTRQALEGMTRPEAAARLDELLSIGTVGGVRLDPAAANDGLVDEEREAGPEERPDEGPEAGRRREVLRRGGDVPHVGDGRQLHRPRVRRRRRPAAPVGVGVVRVRVVAVRSVSHGVSVRALERLRGSGP